MGEIVQGSPKKGARPSTFVVQTPHLIQYQPDNTKLQQIKITTKKEYLSVHFVKGTTIENLLFAIKN